MNTPKHFLIVDDSLVSRMVTKNVIGKLRPDWIFLEASNGIDAISICAQHTIDVACLDLNMPGISGLEAATEIHKIWPSINIAIMTANVQHTVQANILEKGFSFIAKPLTNDKGPELLKALGE
ncbi:MAG: Response regulator receiver domain protein [Pseudomonas sp.]|nr:Response regulator receiver domain protein [Pseudomonas sp.]